MNLSNLRHHITQVIRSKVFLAAFASWTILMLLGALFDLDLSRNLVNHSSSIGNFTAEFGELPGFVLVLISLMIYDVYLLRAEKTWIFLVPLAILTVGVSLVTFQFFVEKLWVMTLLSIVLFVITAIFLQNNWHLISDKIVLASKYTIQIAIIFPLIIVNGIKTVWGRVRYRDLDHSATNFSAWFIPQGITGNRSFPSGHAAMGWMVLCSIFFISDGAKKKLAVVLSVSWAVLVSLGRVLIGAHYFSDVVFSSGCGLLIIWIYHRKLELETATNLE